MRVRLLKVNMICLSIYHLCFMFRVITLLSISFKKSSFASLVIRWNKFTKKKKKKKKKKRTDSRGILANKTGLYPLYPCIPSSIFYWLFQCGSSIAVLLFSFFFFFFFFSRVSGFTCGVCFVIVPHLLFFWCLGKAVLRDCEFSGYLTYICFFFFWVIKKSLSAIKGLNFFKCNCYGNDYVLSDYVHDGWSDRTRWPFLDDWSPIVTRL